MQLRTHAMPGRVQRLLPGALGALILSAAVPAVAQFERAPFPAELVLDTPNTLMAADLYNSQVPEIIATDVQGRLIIFSGETGKVIRRTELADPQAITSPVVGDFLGDAMQEIVIGTDTGEIVIFDAGSLEPVLRQQVTSQALEVPFTVAELPSRYNEGESADILLVPDNGGSVHALEVTADGLQPYWPSVNTASRVSAPVTVGNPRNRDRQDVVVTLRSGEIRLIDAVSGRSDSRADKTNLNQNTPIMTAALLADFTGNGLDEIVVAEEGGNLYVLQWPQDNEPRFNTIAEVRAGGDPTGDPLLAGPLDLPPNQKIILLPTLNDVHAIRPSDNWSRSGTDPNLFSGAKTQLALLPSPSGFPYVAVAPQNELRLIDTSRFFGGSSAAATGNALSVDEGLTRALGVISIRGEGDPFYRVVGLTPAGALVGFDSSLPPNVVDATDTPWMTRGGTPRRNPLFDAEYFAKQQEEIGQRRALVAELEAAVEEALAAGDYPAALESARRLEAGDPLNEEYAKSETRIWIRRNIVMLAIAAIAGIIAVGLLIFVIIRTLILRGIEKKARAAVQSGDFAAAEQLYEKLQAKMPRNKRVSATLAMVYVSTQNEDPKTIDVYRAALALEPGKQNLVQAYAGSLLTAGRTDNEARDAYTAALGHHPEPAKMEYALGLCHKTSGDYQEAGKRLRAALRGGYNADAVYSALVDVYIATKNFSAKALPAFEHEFTHRQSDQKFLEGYLQCCLDARKADSSVESLCHAVLEGNPSHVPAYCHLAMIYLQKNQPGSAIEEVQRALEYEPDNEQAIQLVAHCYLMEGRRDDAAQAAYRKAIRTAPDSTEMLRALAAIYYEQNRYDSEAVELYQKSFEENPNDITTLKALAESAKLSGNHEMSVRAIEALVAQGEETPELALQLAKAYMAQRCHEPKTAEVYREALKAEPDNAGLRAALARTLMFQSREDADSIPVYEAHMKLEPGDREIGSQLARAYQKNGRYQEALELCQRLLKVHPDDPDLKSLVALSSLYSNKLDEAVSEYTQILSANPDDTNARRHLALAYAQKGRTDDEAARLYEKALSTDDRNIELHMAMARVFLAKGDSTKAVERYQQVLKMRPGTETELATHVKATLSEFPDAIRVRWFLCEVLVANGQLREALEQLAQVYDANPNHGKNILGALDRILVKDSRNVQALVMRGKILAGQGNLAESRRALEKAYKLQPSDLEIARMLEKLYETLLKKGDDPEIRFHLARLHYMGQEYDKAIGHLQKTAQDYRWEGESTKLMGKCFAGKGMLDFALQEYKKLVISDDDEVKELLYDLAQRFEAKKNLVGAKEVYRQLWAADMDFRDVKQRFEMLSGTTSDPADFEKTSVVQAMSEEGKRRYELLDELGRGAMGIVYRAKDKELNEVVALKILPDAMSNNPEAVKRFKQEARNARRLTHPSIVRIHDIGEEMGRKYISMEYVDGSDLKKKVKGEGAFPLETFFRYCITIGDALDYAHRLDIVHRDIKPANIMLNSADEVKVTDFGIAKMLNDATAHDNEGTMVGAVIGTPLYMSPEQVQGIPVDKRADIYAFGIMMYEFINGRPPFTQGDLSYQHVNTEPEKPENCPPEIWAIIRKCLEKEKDMRWDTCGEIVDALKVARKKLDVSG